MRRRILAAACGLLVPVVIWAADAVAPQQGVERTILRRQGDEGVHTYRIPGLATTPTGTLIAVFDLRHASGADLPGDIDVGMMRSTDDGATWSRMQVILDFDEREPGSRGNGVGDPAVLVDRRTGHILVAALWSHGDRGWNGSGPGLTPQETGQLVITRSEDDGRTWSAPVNITSRIAGRDAAWRLFFQGPGSGIGVRTGALVFAAQYRDAGGAPHSCFIFSTDGGRTWAVSPPAIAGAPPTSEAQIAELPDGSLLITMRDESRSGLRAWARYEWQDDLAAGRWTPHWSAVPDPTVMASLISHPAGVLLFSNPNSGRERKGMTIRTSTDAGRTWSDGRLIDSRPAAYSSLAVLRDGRIGLLYEAGDTGSTETLVFARFPLEWAQRR